MRFEDEPDGNWFAAAYGGEAAGCCLDAIGLSSAVGDQVGFGEGQGRFPLVKFKI